MADDHVITVEDKDIDTLAAEDTQERSNGVPDAASADGQLTTAEVEPVAASENGQAAAMTESAEVSAPVTWEDASPLAWDDESPAPPIIWQEVADDAPDGVLVGANAAPSTAPLDPARVGMAPQPPANIIPGGTAPLAARRPEPVPEGMEWDEVPTLVLPSTVGHPLPPLPTGALLDDHYVLRGNLSVDDEQNVYRASKLGSDELFTIVESTQQHRGNQQVISQGLSHPHLLPVIDLFAQRPYGEMTRYYAVSPAARESVFLSDTSTPVAVEQAIVWASQLAEVLNYLHEQGVYSPELTPDNVLIEEGRALIGDLSAAQVVVGEEQEALCRRDVAELASTIAFAMSGTRNVTPANLSQMHGADGQPLPEVVQSVIVNALNGGQSSALGFYADLLTAWRAVAAPPTDLILHSGKMTHIGMIRRNNQDSLAAMEGVMMVQSLSGIVGVYVVADGMGGHKAGEVASAITVNAVVASLLGSTITPLYTDEDADDIVAEAVVRQRISHAIQDAGQQVNAMRTREGSDMGTTCVTALVMDGRAYIGNVGDSRAYFYRPGVGIRQVTSDHSLVARLVALGQITEEEAAVHPHRHVIFRSLGDKGRVEVDTFAEPVQAGDRVLLCSDGLSGMVGDAQIAEILANEPDPQAAAQECIELANAQGGVDNISVIIVNVDAVKMTN